MPTDTTHLVAQLRAEAVKVADRGRGYAWGARTLCGRAAVEINAKDRVIADLEAENTRLREALIEARKSVAAALEAAQDEDGRFRSFEPLLQERLKQVDDALAGGEGI